MKINLFLILTFYSFNSQAYEIICPKVSFTDFLPEIEAKTSFDKKSNMYTYKYTFKNHISSRLPIEIVRMQTFQEVQEFKTINGWRASYKDSKGKIVWSAKVTDAKSLIQPGVTMTGFEFKSSSPPGIIQYSAAGWKSVNIKENFPTIAYQPGEKEQYAPDEIEPNCPGEDFKNRLPEIVGTTVGPTPPNTINVKMRLKKLKDKKWQGKIDDTHDNKHSLQISPQDTDKVQVMLFDDKDIDVSKIDLTSIKFGPGRASPVKTEFTKYVDDEKDEEIIEHLKKHNKNHLLMEFNVSDLKVECNLDTALFLEGKIGDKRLAGAVKIKPTLCKDTQKHKVKKIK